MYFCKARINSAQKTLIYFSNDWKDGEKNGYGCVWGSGYESQGYYQNDREIRNEYVKKRKWIPF